MNRPLREYRDKDISILFNIDFSADMTSPLQLKLAILTGFCFDHLKDPFLRSIDSRLRYCYSLYINVIVINEAVKFPTLQKQRMLYTLDFG